MVKNILKRYNVLKVLLFFAAIILPVVNNMLYYSQKTYIEKMNKTVEMSTNVINVNTEDIGSSDVDGELEKIKDFYNSKENVESVTLKKSIWVSPFTDKIRAGSKTDNIRLCLYDERYISYVDGEKVEKLNKNEIILPRYYTPGNESLYNKDGYIDATELIGENIVFSTGVFDSKTAEYFKAEETLKVVGTYDNIAAGNTGEMILASDDTINGSACWGDIIDETEVIDNGYTVYIKYKSNSNIPDILDAKEGIDAPEGYLNMAYSTNTEASEDMIAEMNSVESQMEKYEKKILIFWLIPAVLAFIYIVIGIKKSALLKQLAEIFFNVFIAYMISIIGCLFFAYKQNAVIKEAYEFSRYNTYSFNIVITVGIGVLMVVLAVVFNYQDLKKSNDDIYMEE